MAGVSRLRYPNEIRLIRVMCSGRIDLEFILRAFANGHDGVFLGGCRLGECNYVTQGNFDALANTFICKRIMQDIGLNPERLHIQFMNASDGILLAESITSFSKRINGLGRLGTGEGENDAGLKERLEAVRKIVPYLRLVERERLRINTKTRDAYEAFYGSADFDAMYEELVRQKFVISQIVSLLADGAMTTKEIADAISMDPAAVAKYIKLSTRQGLINYDYDHNKYGIAA